MSSMKRVVAVGTLVAMVMSIGVAFATDTNIKKVSAPKQAGNAQQTDAKKILSDSSAPVRQPAAAPSTPNPQNRMMVVHPGTQPASTQGAAAQASATTDTAKPDAGKQGFWSKFWALFGL